MRFLKVGPHYEFTLTKDLTTTPAPYAVLSHTWGADDEEVTFDDLRKRKRQEKAGYKKLHFCIDQARKDGLQYVWVDTCCIDRANNVELSEAIMSMFRWYRDAAKCYVYISDVTHGHRHSNMALPPRESALQRSRWFTRGWTLQELLAPKSVEFFSQDGHWLGNKITLEQQIHETTRIPVAALRGEPLSTFSVDERFRWAEKRTTRKIEDKAYCLVGIFDVSISFRYGEGDKAFERLKEEIGITLDQIDTAIKQSYHSGRLAVERLSGKSLSLEDCFINLCIVDHNRDSDIRPTSGASDEDSDEDSEHGQLLSKFSLAARLKVETPPRSKQVSLETLFSLRTRTDGTTFRPNRVLIWGRAGMGKTTLCKKIVYDFYHNGLWRDLYDRIVWLPLRRLKFIEHEAHDVVGLIQKEFFPSEPKKNLAERLQKTVIQGKRTLFILDGLDEVSYTLDPDSLMGRILDSLLTRPNVIITSRPHSTSLFEHKPSDLELETIGFFSPQVKEYIQRLTQQNITSAKTASEIQSFIKIRPLVQSLARIPIQLDAICYAWGTKHFPKDNVTITMLYQAISRRLWAKDINRLGKKLNGVPITKQQIENSPNIEVFVETEIRFLEELGFQGLYKEITEFNVADLERLQTKQPILGDSLVQLSFLRSSDSSLEASDRTLHFIHLTFQEFFAARYFVGHWVSCRALSLWAYSQNGLSAKSIERISPEEFLKTKKYISRYDIFWRFVVGLLHTKSEHNHLYRFFKVLEEEPFDLIGLTHQRLTIHCLSEIAPTDGDFQHEVRQREQYYIQWILCESRLQESASRTSLMWEAECSDYVLETLLKNCETRTEVMQILCNCPSVSSNILDVVWHILNTNRETEIEMRGAAIQILGQHCSHTGEKKFLVFWQSIPKLSKMGRSEVVQALRQSRRLLQPAVEALVALLQDSEGWVRSEAASVLGRQVSLPGSAVEALVALLQDPEESVRFEAASVLGRQTSLPGSAVEALVAPLQDPEESVRSQAAWALRGQASLPGSTFEALVALLQNPEESVRFEASWALRGQASLPGSAVEALVALLQDPEESVRSEAASALGRQTSLPGPAVEALVALLQDPKGRVRSQAAWALGRQANLPGSTVEALVALLQDPEESVRSEAASVLGRQTSLPGSAVEALVALLQDPEESVRSRAAAALGRQTSLPGPAVEALVALLQDPEESVRSEAASALGRQASLPAPAVEALVALLQDPKGRVRFEAASALGRQVVLPGSAVEALVALLQDPEESVRSQATWALRGQASLPGSTFEALVALLQDPEESVRYEAAWILGRQASLPGSAVKALVALLQHPEESVRSQAASALGRQTNLPGSTVEAEVALLQDPEESVRSEAASALGRQASLPAPAVEALVALLQDPKGRVRSQAASVLHGQASLPGSTVAALVALLQDPDGSVRSQAAWVLRGQASLPGSAVEALAALLQDHKIRVRSEAASALGRQTSLPGPAAEALVALLQHPDWWGQPEAASALHGLASLPDSAVEALVALLQHPDGSVRSIALSILHGRDEFYYLIPTLDSLALQGLLEAWLRMQSVTCSVWNNSLYIDIYGKQRRIPLQNGQRVLFENAWAEAARRIGVPTLYVNEKWHSCKRRADTATPSFQKRPRLM